MLDVLVLVSYLSPDRRGKQRSREGATIIMSKDGAAGGRPSLSGSADDDTPANASPAAVAQRMSGTGTTAAAANAVGPTNSSGGSGSGMPLSRPGAVPRPVPSASSYLPPGQSLMTAVDFSPIVGKDTVMEEDASKVPPLPPNLSPGDTTAQQQNGVIGTTSDGSAGLDIDQVLGLVDDLPDPASMPEPTPVGSLMSTAGVAATSASVANRGVAGGTSAASNFSSGVSYLTTAGLGTASKTASTSAPAVTTTTAAAPAASTVASGEGDGGDRRERRLERNRESARASRRRRKIYLEELEEKVVSLSEEMDQGRRDHVQRALGTVMELRMDRLKEVERDLGLDLATLQICGANDATVNDDTASSRHNTRSSNSGSNKDMPMNPALEHHIRALDTYLSRTSDEMRLAEIFRKQQLLSLVLPQHRKFVLWLTIQNDVFYRGGRAASERLSAARIGERVST